MVSIKEKIAAQNEGIVADNQATSQPTPMKEPAQQIELSGSTQELENKVVRAPIEERPEDNTKAEPVSTQEPKTGSEMIGQPKQAVSAPNNVEEASKEIGIRDYIRTRNRLSSIQSGQDVIKGVQDGTVGGAELDFIKSNTPELFEAYNQALDEKKSLDAVNRSSKLTDDKEVQEALNVFQQIQNAAIERMKAIADNAASQEDIYNKYLDTPELNEKLDKYQKIQKEIIELNNVMRQTEDDIREKKGGQASESYIRALASNQNKALQRQVDMLEDDRWFAQVDYNTALGSAERRFEFEWADTQAQRDFDQQLVQTQLGMDMQSFGMAWDTLMADKAKEEKEYWYNKEMADKIALMDSTEEQKKTMMSWMRDNGFDNSHLMTVKAGDTSYIYDTQKKQVVETFYANGGTSNSDTNNNVPAPALDGSGEGAVMTEYLNGKTITSYGGKHDNYQGIDIDGAFGDDITAPVSGEIINVIDTFASDESGRSIIPSYGNYIDIKDENGNIHRLAHMSNVEAIIGNTVSKGDKIGEVGFSGYTIPGEGGDGSHIDYSMKNSNGTWKKSTEIGQYLNGLDGSDATYNPNLGSSYMAYMLDAKTPTTKELANLGGLEKFAKDATSYYVEKTSEKMESLGFELFNPSLLIMSSPEQRKEINNDLAELAKHTSVIDDIINDVEENGLPTTVYRGRGKILSGKVRQLQILAKGEDQFNLGVLNGPDLDILEDVIPNPGSPGSHLAGKDTVISLLKSYKKSFIDTVSTQNESMGIRMLDGLNGSQSNDIIFKTPGEIMMEMMGGKVTNSNGNLTYLNPQLYV